MDTVALQPISILPVGAVAARRDALDYVDAMLVELCSIARREQLDMLVFLIDMAHAEAVDQIKNGLTEPTYIPPLVRD